ncbi:hypothetical protein CBR_g24372 [Chara braunii]|uniref:Dynamin-type G domain-containing protein n=1 Tax=Chara braunii TaxID=69332 RepID=A0A388JMP6_CHABU|nr:hypothetical protein CBR_g24372 [Chara braunii]|eukprot:GBG59025.1 hypothetical protein CBR_g24372 [Chara braunii]
MGKSERERIRGEEGVTQKGGYVKPVGIICEGFTEEKLDIVNTLAKLDKRGVRKFILTSIGGNCWLDGWKKIRKAFGTSTVTCESGTMTLAKCEQYLEQGGCVTVRYLRRWHSRSKIRKHELIKTLRDPRRISDLKHRDTEELFRLYRAAKEFQKKFTRSYLRRVIGRVIKDVSGWIMGVNINVKLKFDDRVKLVEVRKLVNDKIGEQALPSCMMKRARSKSVTDLVPRIEKINKQIQRFPRQDLQISTMSYDIKDMFSKLPHMDIMEAVDWIVDHFQSRGKKSVGVNTRGRGSSFGRTTGADHWRKIELEELRRFVGLDLQHTYIKATGVLLKQVAGIPMGKSTSPPLACIMCAHAEFKFLCEQRSQRANIFGIRLIDDVSVVIASKKKDRRISEQIRADFEKCYPRNLTLKRTDGGKKNWDFLGLEMRQQDVTPFLSYVQLSKNEKTVWTEERLEFKIGQEYHSWGSKRQKSAVIPSRLHRIERNTIVRNELPDKVLTLSRELRMMDFPQEFFLHVLKIPLRRRVILQQRAESAAASHQAFIESENNRLEKEAVQFWAKEIVVKIEYKYCPNLTIIDTPGLIAAAPGRKNQQLQAQARAVEALVRAKMQQREFIILCLEDCSDWSNSTTRRVVMMMDPELSRTVIVSTKLDTKIPQFGRAADVELFLRPPPRLLDGNILGETPFFTSVPSGRVGMGRDAVYRSNDHFREAVALREALDVQLLEEKLDRALTKEERVRVGVSRLRLFLEQLLQRRYMESVPLIVPLLDREYRIAQARLSAVVQELRSSNLDESKLKERGRMFRDAFLAKLSLLLRGTVAAPPEKFGETLQDERVHGGAFLGNDGNQLPQKQMPNANMRLYGGAQYHRAMGEFRQVVGAMRCPSVNREEIVNACGVEDIHDGTNYFRTACVIAVAKARDVFEPFLYQLGFRLSHILRRLLPIAMYLLQRDGEYLMGHDMFLKRVASSFNSFVEGSEKSCRDKCMEDLMSTTRYVSWSLHNRDIVQGLVSQIFEGIRDHFVASAELKFNCFFLMPMVDKFPAMLRETLESAYEDDLDNVFDVAEARRTLEAQRANLELELRRVERLQEKFANIHHHLSSMQPIPPPNKEIPREKIVGHA